MTTTETKAGACPACGTPLDAATGVTTSGGPKEGDVSVCLYCACVHFFTADGGVRLPSRTELEALDPEELAVVTRVQRAVTRHLQERRA